MEWETPTVQQQQAQAPRSTRSLLEGKLLNRSLVLVGGRVYNSNTAATAAKSDGKEKMALSNGSTRSVVQRPTGWCI